MGSIKKSINAKIKDNKVMLFTKSKCPHSQAAKKALTDLNVKYGVWDIDLDGADTERIQEYLIELTGAKTVCTM